jgi:hypothetical protein
VADARGLISVMCRAEVPVARRLRDGSFANSTEHRKHVDDVLKEELGHLYVGIPGFFDAFFGDVPGLRPAGTGRVVTVRAVRESCYCIS